MVGPGTGDDCADPVILTGTGFVDYSTFGATTGLEGQAECGAGIGRDLWYRWTAPRSGLATLANCNLFNVKFAAYPGGACPQDGTSFGCNSQGFCDTGAFLKFPVVEGQPYMLQVGVRPNAGPTNGTFDIQVQASECYAYDNGSGQVLYQTNVGAGFGWFSGFYALGGSDSLTELSVQFGGFDPLTPNSPGTLVVYDDPNNDFDLQDAVLLHTSPIVTKMENTSEYASYELPQVPVSGVFFVGVVVDAIPNEAWVVGDGRQPSAERCQFIINTTTAGGFANFNYADPSQNNAAFSSPDSMGPCVFLLRAKGEACGPGTAYCSRNSNTESLLGSSISAVGSASLSAMNFTLQANNVPDEPGLFFFGPDRENQPFGGGRLCVGGGINRLPVITPVAGRYEYTIDFSAFGAALSALDTAHFQCWYRDPGAFTAPWNTSDGLEVVFVP